MFSARCSTAALRGGAELGQADIWEGSTPHLHYYDHPEVIDPTIERIFEVMRALRKGQASGFNITRDICGEARIVERAFGLGACALAEAVLCLDERIRLEAA